MAAIKGRKDSKGYVLRTGESQRNDGRYCYAYSDRNRVRHYIYAKTLPEYSGSVVKTKIQAFYNEPISVAELGRCPR